MVSSIHNQGFFPMQFQGGVSEAGGTLHTQVLSTLAEKTGLDAETLEGAFKDGSIQEILEENNISREDMQQIRAQALDELVSAGEISEDAARSISGRRPPPPPPPGGTDGMAASLQQGIEQLVEELGLESEEELMAMLPEGMSLWAFARENGLDLFPGDSTFSISA